MVNGRSLVREGGMIDMILFGGSEDGARSRRRARGVSDGWEAGQAGTDALVVR